MFNSLYEKIEYEWKRYVNYLMLVSRAEYISRAYEIAAKEAIYRRLNMEIKNKSFNSKLEKQMLYTDNLIDYMYMQLNTKEVIVLKDGNIDDAAWHRIMLYLEF